LQGKKGLLWKGRMNFGGTTREQDGYHWSSSEFVQADGGIILGYKYSSMADGQKFKQECLAYMRDEKNLEKVTYYMHQHESCDGGKLNVIARHKAEFIYSNYEARRFNAAINGAEYSFEL